MKNVLYTIGHSNHTIERFIKLLKQHEINCVVDVRSNPYSRYNEQFNRENIKIQLNQNGIYYIFMGEEFGARRKEKELYTIDGYLDFEKTVKSSKFLNGVERIKEGLKRNFNIAIMCTEKNPIDCHRNIMIAKYFYDIGYEVKNILENGEIVEQQEINRQLVDNYFPDRNQISFLPEKNLDNYDELVKKAYKLKNKEIGYVLESEEEYD